MLKTKIHLVKLKIIKMNLKRSMKLNIKLLSLLVLPTFLQLSNLVMRKMLHRYDFDQSVFNSVPLPAYLACD